MTRGFTLIEVISASLISSILGLALISVFYMANSHLQEGIAYQKLSMVQGMVSAQIDRSAHKAFMVKMENGSGVYEGYADGNDDQTHSGKKQIYFCDTSGTPFAGYMLSGNNLLEMASFSGTSLTGTPAWEIFRIGEVGVFVNSDSSSFDVLQYRSGINYRIRFADSASPSISFPIVKGAVICLNHTRI